MSENYFSFGDFYSCRNANTEINHCRKQNRKSTYWHISLTSFPFIDLFHLPPTVADLYSPTTIYLCFFSYLLFGLMIKFMLVTTCVSKFNYSAFFSIIFWVLLLLSLSKHSISTLDGFRKRIGCTGFNFWVCSSNPQSQKYIYQLKHTHRLLLIFG